MIEDTKCKKLLAIGPRVKADASKVTGPSMMFDLLIERLLTLEWKIKIINIVDERSIFDKRRVGGFTWIRIFFYIKLIPKIWFDIFKKDRMLYLIIAPTMAAFIRDALIIWFSSIMRRKIVCHLFGDYNNFFSRHNILTKKVIGITLSQVDKIIVEGELVKDYMSFINDYKNRVIAISNGLPERNISHSPEPKSISNNSVVNILYMSNMIETKGYLDVLEAVRILINDKKLSIKCHFAGKFIITTDSTEYQDPVHAKDDFFEIIRKNNLEKNVTYSESIFGYEKSSRFNSSHFFILPSNYIYEMQPVSILEAMAYGLVVLATDYKLIPDMVVDEVTGYLIPYNAPHVIANKIESLIQFPEKYMVFSKNSISMYNEKFSADIYCDKMNSVLYDLACPSS